MDLDPSFDPCAEWIRLKATTGEPTFEDYRTMLLAKLPNSTKIDLLLTYENSPSGYRNE